MSSQIRIEPGSKEWEQLRKRCTVPEPGAVSALFFLAAKVIGLEKKIPLTIEEHLAMCLFAERATGIPEIDNARVQLIHVPRGIGKSATITGVRSIQRLCQNPEWTIGIANETQVMANRFLSQIKLNFEGNSFFRMLFPELIPGAGETTWREDEIVIKRPSINPNPSVLAAGVGATRTGIHLNEWIGDDLISKDHAEAARRGNYAPMEAVNNWIIQLPPLLNRPTRDPMTFVGTPWYMGDTWEFVERFFGFVPPDVTDLERYPKDFETIWTLRLPGGIVQNHYLYRRGDIAVFRRPALEAGRSFFPSFWSTEELEKMQLSPEGAEFFSANFMLKPSAGAAAMFRPEWLKTYELDGPDLRYRNQEGRTEYVRIRDLLCYISVDPAFSKKNSACRSAIPVVGTDGTNVFLLEDYAKRGIGIEDIANVVVNFAMKYNPRKIFVETIVAQIAVADAIRRVARERGIFVPIEEIPSHGGFRKETRIFGLEPYFKRGIFYMHPSHAAFREEYLAFPRSALRDVLDALSFQKDEWERVAQAMPRNGPDAFKDYNSSTLARLRKSTGRGGGY